MESENQALERLKDKSIKVIQHHDIIGVVEIHFEDGSCLSVQAVGKAETSIMITEPSK
ncbi:TPA: hypothetical protein ACF334_004477 [Vibrio parahaemolyticus]